MSLKRSLFELARCAKHNLLHLRRFKIAFRGDHWVVRHDRGELRFGHYPYLAFHDIEGYLKNGDWSIHPGEVAVDAGGCFGEFALYLSQCVGPAGRVLMLEPDEANLAVARRNVALNGSPANLTIVPAGLWHERGTVRFATGLTQESSMVGDAAKAADAAGSPAVAGSSVVEVPTVALADLVSDHQLDRLDFVKMDIEGAELEALSAAKDLSPGMRPRYAIASYHPRDGEPTAKRCEAILAGLGYRVSTGNPRHPTTWASP